MSIPRITRSSLACKVLYLSATPSTCMQEKHTLGQVGCNAAGLSLGLGIPFPSKNLVALYCAIRSRFRYGFESCDANSPRNVKHTNLAKHRAVFFFAILPVGSQELVFNVPKLNSVQTRCIVKTSGFTRGVCKNRCFY